MGIPLDQWSGSGATEQLRQVIETNNRRTNWLSVFVIALAFAQVALTIATLTRSDRTILRPTIIVRPVVRPTVTVIQTRGTARR